MITRYVLAVLILSMAVGLYGQTSGEPVELTTMRENWVRATRQATAPIDLRYQESLATLKLRLTKAGKLNEAMAVDAELQKLAHGSGGASANGPNKLAIISATYRKKGAANGIDTTDILRKALEGGEAGIRLTTKFGAGGKDPAYNLLKETEITYRIRGETKTKIFAEGYDLKFKDDLK
ncbi:MAG: hypothetical protein ABL994_03565 [Verrucomicrobiales bacterium]